MRYRSVMDRSIAAERENGNGMRTAPSQTTYPQHGIAHASHADMQQPHTAPLPSSVSLDTHDSFWFLWFAFPFLSLQ